MKQGQRLGSELCIDHLKCARTLFSFYRKCLQTFITNELRAHRRFLLRSLKNAREQRCSKGWAKKGRQGTHASRLETGTCWAPPKARDNRGRGQTSNSSKCRTHSIRPNGSQEANYKKTHLTPLSTILLKLSQEWTLSFRNPPLKAGHIPEWDPLENQQETFSQLASTDVK